MRDKIEQMMLKKIIKKLVSGREIIIRQNGEVKYVSLQAKALGTFYGAVAIVIAAALFSAWSYYDLSESLNARDQKISKFKGTIAELTAGFSKSQTNLKLARNELDQQYDRIEKVIAERANLHETLKSVHADLKQTKFDRNSRAEYASALESKIGSLTNGLASVNAYSEGLTLRISRLNRQLSNITRDRNNVVEERTKLTQEKSALLSELASYRQDKEVIYRDLQESKQALASIKQQLELSKFDGIKQSERIDGLNSALLVAKAERKELVAHVHEQAITGIDALRETIALTGLDPDKLLQTSYKPSGKGGPFVDFSPAEISRDNLRVHDAVQEMELSLSQWSELQSMMHHIPIAKPTDIGFVSSSFGMRRDPITKKRAKHGGVDIAAYKNTPIFATAEGEVVFAGRKGPYGRMVVVDHGLGFKTKYGHMKKILVKKGQKIDFRTKLGLMGSTGRSTGYHVHYEVLYNDNVLNPVRFFKAGKYAYKIKPRDTEGKSG